MKALTILALLWFTSPPVSHEIDKPGLLGSGRQPQLTLDQRGVIRLVYGNGDKIYYCVSNDQGKTFSQPEVIGEIKEMHLGMTRGPQFATSKNYSLITAIDKKGNIHSFQLDHKKGAWSKISHVSDVSGSAAEGLISIAADASDNFYAVWLDLREDKNNKIAFASIKGEQKTWTKSKIVYTSPDQTVCECCKPSIAVQGNSVSIMFRNFINGFRDLHVITSLNKGQSFSKAVKLGRGTWKLKGCPMDGGGVLIDSKNNIHTVWQREGQVYYAQPGQEETRISEGRGCSIFGTENILMTWEQGEELHAKSLEGKTTTIGAGTALNIVQLKDRSFLAAWEREGRIFFKSFN